MWRVFRDIKIILYVVGSLRGSSEGETIRSILEGLFQNNLEKVEALSSVWEVGE